MRILSIVGARPNFMKIAPISDELMKRGVNHTLVHTGQHYDYKMSQLFFKELGLPRPHINLGIGSGTHAQQSAEIMMRLEPVLTVQKPSLVIVVGDVNSTMASAITAAKLGIPVAHVEAGLRSFDKTMPEEINRVLTDSISSYHFTTEESANENLKREGFSGSIFFVGNTMIDTLLKHVEKAESTILERLSLRPYGYGVVTLHRPSNVENRENLANILEALHEISRELPLVFPIHPRTKERVIEFGLNHFFMEKKNYAHKGFFAIDPLGYIDFLKLMKESKIVFTDSGGIQEETTILKIPCLTLRYNTERPVTIYSGTNILVGADKQRIIKEARKRLDGFSLECSVPTLWDGCAAERIVDIITKMM